MPQDASRSVQSDQNKPAMNQFSKDEDHRQKRIFLYVRQASGGNIFFAVRQLMLAEKKIRVLSFLQQKMLVEASKVSFASNEPDFCSPKDVVESERLYNFLGKMKMLISTKYFPRMPT